MWTTILSHLVKNWLAYTVGALVLVAYLWVNGLYSTIERNEKKIGELEVKLETVALEAKRQADAFTYLDNQFKLYQTQVSEYLAALEASEAKGDEARDVVRSTGTDQDRKAPVAPYIKEVLDRLCQVYPASCG